jgi:hypothetical protein
MKIFFNSKAIAIALILFSLVLPLSRCSRDDVRLQEGSLIIDPTQKPVRFDYQYPKDWFLFSEVIGWLALLTYTWPLILLLVKWKFQNAAQSRAMKWAEVFLCIGGGTMVWELSSFGERLVGAYVALAGMGLYLITTIRDLRLPIFPYTKNQV